MKKYFFLLLACALGAMALADAPPSTPSAAPPYEKTAKPPFTRQGSTVMEDDKDAQGGKALRMAPEKKQANVVSDYYFYPAYPGRYRFTWRLKIDDNTGDARVVDLHPQFPAWGDAKTPTLSLKPTDWKQAGVYQNFSVEGLVPEHDYGVLSTYFDPAPGRSVWWDTGTFTRLERFDDERIAKEFYPAFVLPETVTRKISADKLRTYVMYHPSSYETSGLRAALSSLGLQAPTPQQLPADMRSYQPPPARVVGQWREVAYIDHPQSRLPAPGFPDTSEALADLDLIVLSDASPRALTAPARLLLREWVRQGGGGVLLTGGMNAFGKGNSDGTVFEEMLPVELAGNNDLKIAKDGKLFFKDAALQQIAGDAVLGTKFYHALKAKPGARVLIESGEGAPLLVEWSYGKGHVAAWLGAALGSTPEGQTAWWKSDKWPSLLAEVLKRMAGQ
jgi:uncharacterized membrane protein